MSENSKSPNRRFFGILNRMKMIVQLILAIGIAQLAGVIGSFATISAIPGWYDTLLKPAFSPPNWVFGPVWLILYTLIGISLFLVWRAKNKKKVALIAFFVHLALNALWSLLFFGLFPLNIK